MNPDQLPVGLQEDELQEAAPAGDRTAWCKREVCAADFIVQSSSLDTAPRSGPRQKPRACCRWPRLGSGRRYPRMEYQTHDRSPPVPAPSRSKPASDLERRRPRRLPPRTCGSACPRRSARANRDSHLLFPIRGPEYSQLVRQRRAECLEKRVSPDDSLISRPSPFAATKSTVEPKITRTSHFRNTSSIQAETSPSIMAIRRVPRSTSVTFAPRAWQTVANSTPTGPPPTMTMCFGARPRYKMVSVSQTPGMSNEIFFGRNGREPVAIRTAFPRNVRSVPSSPDTITVPSGPSRAVP